MNSVEHDFVWQDKIKQTNRQHLGALECPSKSWGMEGKEIRSGGENIGKEGKKRYQEKSATEEKRVFCWGLARKSLSTPKAGK